MKKRERFLPREVWVACISLKNLWPADTIEKRTKDILRRMESVYAFEPDVIVIPETYNISWVKEEKTLEAIAEEETSPGSATSIMAGVARNHNCYVVCPVITKKDGHFYNSSILLDRQGKISGIYHKIHPVDTEIIPEKYYKGGGVTPGELRPPVFRTDFGTVGMQICMDDYWHENWQSLHKDGAELVLFPSQGPFGDLLNHRAWMNHYYIASATGEDARIIDISGDTIAADGEFARWVCAPVNLEKVLIHIWPQVRRFDEIQKKYGQKIRIKIYHPENWATIESLDPDVKVREVLREFDLPDYDEQLREATVIQDKFR